MKVYLLCQGKRIKKKKTTVKKKTLYPAYNESLIFDVPADNIEDVSLIVKVIDHDRSVGKKDSKKKYKTTCDEFHNKPITNQLITH